MFSLIPLVMAITLSSIIAVTTMSIMPISIPLGTQLRAEMVSGFLKFETAHDLYKVGNMTYIWQEDCPPGSTLGTNDPLCEWDRLVDDDGGVDTTPGVWEAELTPNYLFIPSLSENFSWSLGTNNSDASVPYGIYVCAQGSYNDVSVMALRGIINSSNTSVLRVGGSCAPASGFNKTDLEAYVGSTIFATKWISK
jgi:hypothetical protein